jgi:membrane-bound ClpP family serine protease
MSFRNIFWGVVLVITGSLFLVEELTSFDFGRFFWPIIMITSGVLLLLRNYISADTSNQTYRHHEK